MFCAQPAVLLFTFGTFSAAIAADTGWSRLALAGAITPGLIASALLAPLIGGWADRIGTRKALILGAVSFALGMTLLGLAPTGVTSFYVWMTVAGALGFVGTPVLSAKIVTDWFGKRRGLGLSIIFCSTSIGVAIWSPVAASLIAHIGWRLTYVAIGIVVAVIALAVGLLLVRDPPVARTRHSGANSDKIAGLSLKEALGTSRFWRISCIFVLLTGVLAGTSVNLPVMLNRLDVAPALAATVIAATGLSMFFSRLTAGILLDRWFAPYVTACYALAPLIGFALLLNDQSVSTFYVAAACIGLGLGAELDAAAYVISRSFGVRAFGAIYGVITMLYGISSAVGAGIIGAVILSGMAIWPLLVAAIFMVGVAILLLVTLKRAELPYAAKA